MPKHEAKNMSKSSLASATTIQHLAVIMDGNRRWAKERGLPSAAGHREGATAVERTIKFCLSRGIKILSMYAFSLENFKRDDEEKSAIFDLMQDTVEHWPKKFDNQNIRIRFVGNRSMFPAKVLPAVEKIEQTTAQNTGLLVNVMFCYGGQQEIVDAAKILANKIAAGELDAASIDEKTLAQHTWTGDSSPPDLIIRTGKRARLSNFMTYQSCYSEIYFSDLYWPEVQASHLSEACEQFEKAARTFGS